MVTRAVKAAKNPSAGKPPSKEEQEKTARDVGQRYDGLIEGGMSSGDAVRKVMKEWVRSDAWVYYTLRHYRKLTGVKPVPAVKDGQARPAKPKRPKGGEPRKKRTRVAASNGAGRMQDRIAEGAELFRRGREILDGIAAELAEAEQALAAGRRMETDGHMRRTQVRSKKK